MVHPQCTYKPYQDHIVTLVLKKIKPRDADMKCWSILSDYISYSISYSISPLYHRMILTDPENVYNHKICRSFLNAPMCPMSQLITRSGFDKEDYLDAYKDASIQFRNITFDE